MIRKKTCIVYTQPISDKVWGGQRYAKKTSVQDAKTKFPMAIVEFSEIEWATCWAFDGFEGFTV